MSNDAIRREHISSNLQQLIRVGRNYSVSELLHTLLRRKNFNGDPYKASDAEVSSAVEDMLSELKHEVQKDFRDKISKNGTN